MAALIEKALHQEVMLRLRPLPVVAFSVPNSVYLPARTEAERTMAARIIHQMKAAGQMTPGAPDIVVCGRHGTILAELKRSASRDLLTKRPAGRLSPEQREFRERCERAGVRYVVAHCWEDVEGSLEGLW